MNPSQKSELEALVVGFLQQGLQQYPRGYSLREFEKIYPEKTDEPRNWYQSYGCKNTLEALKYLKESVIISQRDGFYHIALNMSSQKVDRELVDLIQHQRPSGKKRPVTRNPHRSFAINRQYQEPTQGRGLSNMLTNNRRSSQQHDSQQYRWSSSNNSAPLKPRQPSIATSYDPRTRQPTMVPPQLVRSNLPSSFRQPTATSSPKPVARPLPTQPKQPLPPTPPTSASPASSTSSQKPQVKSVPTSTSVASRLPSQLNIPQTAKQTLESKSSETSEVLAHKERFRQRILYLLNKKYGNIKLLHLNSLYEIEFEEKINFSALGHTSLKPLLFDPVIKPYVQIDYTFPPSISIRKSKYDGKENEAPDSTISSESQTSYQAQYNVISTFNLQSMSQCLDPLGTLKEPETKQPHIEDQVKYKTMRIIFKSPNHTLKLEDWVTKYNQETKLWLSIKDYGFKTLLEFFKHLAQELPIKIHLNKQDEWIAQADLEVFSGWLNKKMEGEKWTAMIAVESIYETAATPNDTYNYTNLAEFKDNKYHPTHILGIRNFTHLYLEQKTAKRVEELSNVEAHMTYYEDHRLRDLLSVPSAFVRPGFPCAVYDKHLQKWCRALILKAPEIVNKETVVIAQLVDYALERKFIKDELLCLHKTYLKHTVGVIYAKLAGLNVENNEPLKRKAKQILHEYSNPKPVTLACKIVSAIPTNNAHYLPRECFAVELIDTREDNDCNLTQHILRQPGSD